jgi:hypothetical protein
MAVFTTVTNVLGIVVIAVLVVYIIEQLRHGPG